MKELRKYWDGQHSYLVNVRTRIVRFADTGEYPDDETAARVLKAVLRRVEAAKRRRAIADAYESCGMVRVRGALGGTYWE